MLRILLRSGVVWTASGIALPVAAIAALWAQDRGSLSAPLGWGIALSAILSGLLSLAAGTAFLVKSRGV